MNDASCPRSAASTAITDTDLLTLISNEEEAALERLYERHSSSVYSVALAILKDTSAAEDVLQEVFLRLWRKSHLFDELRGSLRGWLVVAARNQAIDMLRQRKHNDSIDDVAMISSSNISLECENSLLMERARVLIASLPQEQREALSMAFFQGMTHDEISRATGVPLGTIKTRIRAAIQCLAKGFRRNSKGWVKADLAAAVLPRREILQPSPNIAVCLPLVQV